MAIVYNNSSDYNALKRFLKEINSVKNSKKSHIFSYNLRWITTNSDKFSTGISKIFPRKSPRQFEFS